mgnify:CR=1 FL=1
MIRVVFLLFCASSFTYAQYFYSQGKKVQLLPHLQSRSADSKPSYTIEGTKEKIGIYEELIFQLEDNADLRDIVKKYNLQEVQPLGLMMYSAKSKNTLATSNAMYEDDKVTFAHPDFEVNIRTKSTNNPLSQYTGHLRAIEVEKLWEIATNKGEGIKVGIVDTIVDATHEDLKSNLLDKYTPINPAAPQETHGTNCIGVILAADNDLGSVGIAPNSKFYSVGLSSKLTEVIAGINWLTERNVAVVNNSWGTYLYDALEIALKNLATNGRDGKGAIVLFASGNNNANYDINPAVEDQSEYDFVLGIGATDESGELTNYTNYGEKIDLYAFGGGQLVGVLTTAPFNAYTATFGGTSAAAPIVAGVVTLMLEVNPDLTLEEIRTILRETGDDTSKGFKRMNALRALERTRDALVQPLPDEDLIVIDTNATILPIGNKDNLSIVINSIESVSLKKGWNMLGTSYDIDSRDLYNKWDDIVVQTQDREQTGEVVYEANPSQIKAGEGFWIYQR